MMSAACASAPSTHPGRPNSPTRTDPPVAPIARQTALDADGRLGADLLDVLGPSSQNAVLSPYSIAVALQMALEGARGQTAEQMAKTLHLPGVSAAALTATAATLGRDLARLDGSGVTLRIANGLWPQAGYPIKAPFTQALQDGFGVGVRAVDFAKDPPGARRAINDAISEQTNGKIPELFTADLDPRTRLVLTNAVYLKAAWSDPFTEALTRPDTFHAVGHDVSAPFMHGTVEVGYAKRAGYQLVRLPYQNGRLAMTLIVPDGPLAPLEDRLRREGLGALLGGPLSSAYVTLSLPKFQFRTHVDLNDALSRLGMTDAFVDGRADFTGITDPEALHIAQVVHEANISVDEKGTEAAAATGVVIRTSSATVNTAEVTVDHPFLFAITDLNTDTPLFLGRVVDPTAS